MEVDEDEIRAEDFGKKEKRISFNFDIFDKIDKKAIKTKTNSNKKDVPQKLHSNKKEVPVPQKPINNKKEVTKKPTNNKKEIPPKTQKTTSNKKEVPQKEINNKKPHHFEDESPDEEEYDETYQQVKKLKENLIKNDKKNNIKQKNRKEEDNDEEEEEEEEEEVDEEEEEEEDDEEEVEVKKITKKESKKANNKKEVKKVEDIFEPKSTKYKINQKEIQKENEKEKEKEDEEKLSDIIPPIQSFSLEEKDKEKEKDTKENIDEENKEKDTTEEPIKEEPIPVKVEPIPVKVEEKPTYVENRPKISQFEMINQDPSLKNYEWCIRRRYDHYKRVLGELERNEQSLVNFAKSYETMGVHVLPNGDIRYREYAPGCKGVSLYGEFNNWKKDEFWAIKDAFGRWELIIKSDNGQPRIKHGQKIKANVVLKDNNWVTRNPIWCHYLVQNKQSFIFDAVFWNPDTKYQWKYPKKHMSRPKTLRVYESHVGMATKEQRVGSYREFADNIIPRLKDAGYNAVQLMAIMEHADYASFGYHVNNIFAISSRFGSPEDLMYLIDTAHQKGVFVIMDIVHSHASNNVDDGFNYWDGTDYLYFHSGPMGKHTLWDSRLYNYSSYETLRLLLSNCAFFIDVYHFDGFRFDGITSILYKNHGICHAFTGGYGEYYGNNFDEDGGVYLMLANKLIHEINPEAITIAEDVSGMPGLCRPVEEGGFGFDYRLNMSVCDKWIQLLKEYSDEDWNMGNIVFTLTNRRYNEKHIGYAESHDQSIVGDKTISMWLFDKEMYWNMANSAPETPIINRGFALHKMIRMITFALGGEGYLCFMGNEFGHPEWVDFPRPGNGFSYAHCCRRWDLCDNGYLRYKFLYNWDVAMNRLDEVFYFISSPFQYVSTQHEKDKVIVFEKGDLLFVFNFHPYRSFENYKIGTKWKSEHRIILDSDEGKFFGKERLRHGHEHRFPCLHSAFNNRPCSMNVYIPSRTCMVLIAEENEKKYDLKEFEKYNDFLKF